MLNVFNCLYCPQGEAGAPGQAGVDGVRGDQGARVGVKSTFEPTLLLLLFLYFKLYKKCTVTQKKDFKKMSFKW